MPSAPSPRQRLLKLVADPAGDQRSRVEQVAEQVAGQPEEYAHEVMSELVDAWHPHHGDGVSAYLYRSMSVLAAQHDLPPELQERLHEQSMEDHRLIEQLIHREGLLAVQIYNADPQSDQRVRSDRLCVRRLTHRSLLRVEQVDDWVPDYPLANHLMAATRLQDEPDLRAHLLRTDNPRVREYLLQHLPAEEFAEQLSLLLEENPDRAARALPRIRQHQKSGLNRSLLEKLLAHVSGEGRRLALRWMGETYNRDPEALADDLETNTPESSA